MKTCVGLTYEDLGTGNITLICLHGIGGNTDSFRPQLDELSNDTRVIAVNLPGYGGSEQIDPVTFESLCDKLVEFLNDLDLEQVILCGQSIGGMLALDFAIRYPSRVKRLVLIATTSAFGGRDDQFKSQFLKARLAPLDAGKTMPELAHEFVPEIVGPAATQEAVQSAISSMSKVPVATYRAVISCLVTFNRRADLGKITQHACLIAGEHDQNAPAKTMQRMAEKMPNATYLEIEEAGHLVNQENGGATNKIIRKFLNLGGQNDR